MDHDVGAVLDRAADVPGGAERVVDHQRDAVAVGHLGDGLEVGNVVLRVADRLEVEGLGPVVDPRFEVVRLVAVDELDLEAEAGEGDLELVVGAPVEVAGADDVVTGLQQRGEGE